MFLKNIIFKKFIWEATKKVLGLVAGPLRGRGGGLNGCATKNKELFLM